MKDIIIIGGGPAGMAAAIQLTRFGKTVQLFEKDVLGGLMRNANLIENYLGFPDGISGTELSELMIKQYLTYDINTIYDKVIEIIEKNKIFSIKTNDAEYKAKYVILATGTEANKINLDIPPTLKKNIFYEAVDLFDVSGKEIIVVGSGDIAFDYALNLAKRGNKIKILNRGNEIKAIGLLVERVNKNQNIEYFENTKIESIAEIDNQIKIDTNNERVFMCDFLLYAIGRKPNNNLINSSLKNNKNFFIVGDVKNGMLKQISIAIGNANEVAQIIDISRDAMPCVSTECRGNPLWLSSLIKIRINKKIGIQNTNENNCKNRKQRYSNSIYC